MLRAMLINPLIVALTAIVGILIFRAIGADPHLHNLALAAGVCLVAAETAIVPVRLQRSADPAARAQATFLGTVLHLMLTVILAVTILWILRPDMSFVYWMLVMYWMTLIGLSAICIRTVRSVNVVGQGR